MNYRTATAFRTVTPDLPSGWPGAKAGAGASLSQGGTTRDAKRFPNGQQQQRPNQASHRVGDKVPPGSDAQRHGPGNNPYPSRSEKGILAS